MPQPPAYTRTKDFTADFGSETDHASLNAELDAASNSINDIRTNLGLIQADDGRLRAGAVTTDTLTTDLKNYLIDQATAGAVTYSGIAQTEAGNAATSATNAANSAASASTSATNASASATAAASSAASASNSATSAATSESNAANSASTASTAATTATSAATSATNSASSASTSATTASNAATTATSKAGEAATSAGNAAASATNAGNSASAAETSATNAANSASAAAASASTINDANLVHKTGDETIAGVKTFSVSPVVPDLPTGDNSGKAVNSKFVQAAVVDPSSVADATKDRNVSKVLRWKNYGNGHVIFDASAGTAPNGAVVSKSDVIQPWAPSFPTLMGWNGSETYGVRVDSSRVSDRAYGLWDSPGAPPHYSCRAWAAFNGSGGMYGGGNVSSVTDNGAGDYTVNFATAMPDANYAVGGAVSRETTAAGAILTPHSMSQSAFRFTARDVANTARDGNLNFIQIFR